MVNNFEIVDVVDENDIVIETALKEDVYKKGLNNRIVHVFVINPESRSVFLQKRGANVSYLPNHYCTSAGGHVASGEDYDIAAQRELEEEIGLNTELHYVDKFSFTCSDSGTRFISLYITYASKGFSLCEDEVSEGYFVTITELETILNNDDNLHPQLSPCFEAYKKSKYFNN